MAKLIIWFERLRAQQIDSLEINKEEIEMSQGCGKS